MAQTLTRLLVHIVFSTKDREDLISPVFEATLYAYIGGICRNAGSPLLRIGGTANHVHLLVSLSKTLALADLLLDIKRDSSRWIKTQPGGSDRFLWQEGYGAFTISERERDAVTRYIDRQKEHHREVTFEQEVLRLLSICRVEYDERYIWT